MSDEEKTNHLLNEQLTRLTDRRTAQDNVLWQVFAVFTAGNGALVAWTMDDKFNHLNVPVFGIVVSLVWFLIQQRVLLQIVRCETVASAIEEKLGIASFTARPTKELLKKDKRGRRWLIFLAISIPARLIMPVISATACGYWVYALRKYFEN